MEVYLHGLTKRRKVAMASTGFGEDQTCLMCLDTPADITIRPCSHAYCRPCLTKHAEQHLQEGDTFPCQTGREQCPREALSKDGSKLDLETAAAVTAVLRESCNCWRFKGNNSKAVNDCIDCSNLELCKECTLVHGSNKATKYHSVIPIDCHVEKNVLRCEAHGELMQNYCCTCFHPVCHICVVLKHGDHQIKTVEDACHDGVKEVESMMHLEEKRLEMLQADLEELAESKATAVGMEDALIKTVEDHAQRCIDDIVKNKDALKTKVRETFKATEILAKQLDDMPGFINESKDAIFKAKKLLKEAELRPSFLEKLHEARIKEHFHELKVGEADYVRDRESWRSEFTDLRQQKPLEFYQKKPNLDIGGFEKLSESTLKEICRDRGYCTCEECGKARNYRKCFCCKDFVHNPGLTSGNDMSVCSGCYRAESLYKMKLSRYDP